MFSFFSKNQSTTHSCFHQKSRLVQALGKEDVDSVNRWERTLKLTKQRPPITFYCQATNPLAQIFFESMAACIDSDDSVDFPLSLTTPNYRIQMIYQDMD